MRTRHSQIEQEREKFGDFLDKSGLRFTSGRTEVFEQVMKTHGHFTPEELVKFCLQRNRKVSRATVYRSLKELLEAGIIRETAYGQKHAIFEHIYDEKKHHHARCIHCHSVIEFPDLDEDIRYRPLLEKEGFKILGHEMHFYGICQACRA
jgi:Fur family ferric uptake transcriptional regulator